MNLSTDFPEIITFHKLWPSCPPDPGYLAAIELKGPRPVMLDKDEPEEKRRAHGPTLEKKFISCSVKYVVNQLK